MSRWQAFLNSFNTPGGNLLLLVISTAVLFAAVIHVLENPHPNADQTVTLIVTTFSGFVGALLARLSGRTADIPKNGTTKEPNP